MAKSLTSFKNPLTSSGGSVFDITAWTGGILWVMMTGIIIAMGAKLLNVVDQKIPGSQTPNMVPYVQPSAGPGYTVF